MQFGVLPVLLAHPGDGLFHGVEAVADFSVGADFPVSARFGHGD